MPPRRAPDLPHNRSTAAANPSRNALGHRPATAPARAAAYWQGALDNPGITNRPGLLPVFTFLYQALQPFPSQWFGNLQPLGYISVLQWRFNDAQQFLRFGKEGIRRRRFGHRIMIV